MLSFQLQTQLITYFICIHWFYFIFTTVVLRVKFVTISVNFWQIKRSVNKFQDMIAKNTFMVYNEQYVFDNKCSYLKKCLVINVNWIFDFSNKISYNTQCVSTELIICFERISEVIQWLIHWQFATTYWHLHFHVYLFVYI